MPILVDFNQVAISNLMINLKMNQLDTSRRRYASAYDPQFTYALTETNLQRSMASLSFAAMVAIHGGEKLFLTTSATERRPALPLVMTGTTSLKP